MSLISYLELCQLVEDGVINAKPEQINGSSIDLTLHNLIRVELGRGLSDPAVRLKDKQNISTVEYDLDLSHVRPNTTNPNPNPICGYILRPDEFILASSHETFNLPDYISCEYKLKSSMARNGLEHLNAGWCDAGWHNSRLTLELKNITRYHKLLLETGMPIGQVVFFKHEPVPVDKSYATRGQYNNQGAVTESKGIR
jgi:dCTP deaminase